MCDKHIKTLSRYVRRWNATTLEKGCECFDITKTDFVIFRHDLFPMNIYFCQVPECCIQ